MEKLRDFFKQAGRGSAFITLFVIGLHQFIDKQINWKPSFVVTVIFALIFIYLDLKVSEKNKTKN